MQPKTLSKGDSKIIAQVFDPESGPAKAEIIVNPDLPSDRCIADDGLLSHLKAKEKQAIAIIEECELSEQEVSIQAAYESALEILDNLVQTYPDYASARNNRAQLRRWRFRDRDTLVQKESQTDIARRDAAVAAVADLRTCIELASPERPRDAVSPSQGRLLVQAHTQLGALYYAAFKDLEANPTAEVTKLSGSRWTKVRFEDEASRLFYLGGLYGNEVAKALAVHTNPHAKLCGSIVKEAMREELSGAASRGP